MSGSSEVPATSDPKATDWDRALPFQLDALGVRGRLVRLGPALDAIIERHGYPLAVARPLAEAMTLCAALATSLKYDGIFTLQISGDGPIRLLVTDLTTDGALRGYAQFDSWKLAVALGGLSRARRKATCRGCSATAGSPSPSTRASTPSATRAWCRWRAPRSPTAPTPISASPSSCRPASRSRPSATSGTAAPIGAAAALMVQQMPEFDAGRIDVDAEQREDDWRKAVILMASATEAEMLDPKLPSAQLLRRLFHAEQPRVFERRVVRRALPLQPRAHRPRAALAEARGAVRPARPERSRRREVRVLLDRIRLRRRRSRPDLRLGSVKTGWHGACNGHTSTETP